MSETAADLLEGANGEMLAQATRLSSSLLDAVSGAPRVAPAASCALPSPDGRTIIRAQLLPAANDDFCIVVVFLPAKPTAASGECLAWGLTRRESDVAREIAVGSTTKEIASHLSISIHTARRHTERVFAKLGVRSRSQVVRLLATGR